jgi:hypothetical protein
MATKKTTAPKGQPKACPAIPENPPIQIPFSIFSKHFDGLMTAQRLALAIHRMRPLEPGITSTEEFLSWEIFSAVHAAVDELGHLAGFSVEEREPE